jgi:predicted nucleic acid-binding protein
MPVFYFDTSAALKRYVTEVGSAWIRAITDPARRNRIHTVSLAGPELVAALARLARAGEPSSARAGRAIALARSDVHHLYVIREIDVPLLARAMDIAETHGLRGSDAMHLAGALAVERDRLMTSRGRLIFVSADREQLHAAAAEGLRVDDPNLHP